MAAEKPAKRPRTVRGIFPYRDGYRTDVSLGVDPVTGKRRRETIYGATVREVEDRRRELLANLARGVTPETGKQPLAEYLTWWLAEIVKPRVRRTSFLSTERICRVHLIPLLGGVQVAKLTPRQVQAALNERAATLAPASIRQIRSVLVGALAHAVKWEVLPRNVASLTEAPPQKRHAARTLTPAEARGLVEAAGSHRLGALIVVMLSTGLRRGEALGIPWSDVDLPARRLYVRQQVQWIDGEAVISPLKTASSERTVPLPAMAVAALTAHRQRQQFERRAAGDAWQETGLAFCSATGEALGTRNVGRWFTRLTATAGLPGLTMHDLRHTFVSALASQRVSVRATMEAAGHSTSAITMEVYAHASDPDLDSIADAIDATFATAG